MVGEEDLGLRFLTSLFSLLRTAAIHEANNRALERPSSDLRDALAELFLANPGDLEVFATDGQLFINESRVYVPANRYHYVKKLEELFEDRSIGGLAFDRGISDDELRRFAFVLQHFKGQGSETIDAALAASQVGNIRVRPPVRARMDVESAMATVSGEVRATLRYAKAAAALGQLLEDPDGKLQLREPHFRRLVHEIAESAAEALDFLIGLTELNRSVGDRARLAIDTCVVCVALGRALGLERSRISDLGMAALFLLEPGFQSASPTSFLRELSEHQVWNASLLRRVLAVSQRRQPVRASAGTPPQRSLSRIFRIGYDFMCLTHGFAADSDDLMAALSARDALDLILGAPPHVYDPVLVRHLVAVVGPFPVGTCVILKDGRQGLVIARTQAGRPVIRIRLSPMEYGDLYVPEDELSEIEDVNEDIDAEERATVLLESKDLEDLATLTQQITQGVLGRVSLQRVAIDRKPED